MYNKKISKPQTRIVDSSYLLSCFLLAVAIVFSTANSSASAPIHEISEMFIEASGNNKYEAKIKAHELGMQRALVLVGDKLSLPANSISNAPYKELSTAFTVVEVTNEVSLVAKYSATVTYSYKIGEL